MTRNIGTVKGSPRRSMRTAVAVIALSCVTSFGLAACSSGGSSDGAGVSSKIDSSAPLAKLVPDSIKKKGEIVVADEYGRPPQAFLKADKKTWTGIDADMVAAVGKQLGVPTRMVLGDHSAMAPALKAKRYDVFWTTLTVSDDLKKAGTLVSYMNSGTGWVVPNGNPKKIDDSASLCGLTAAVGAGSYYVDLLKDVSTKTCTDKGKQAIKQETTQGIADAVLAVQTGRADFAATSTTTAAYTAEQSKGQLDSVTPSDQPLELCGVLLDGDNTALGKAFAAALQNLIDNGTYGKILTKYGVSDLAITKSEILS